MRASVASLSKKIISTFFAATLALGLVPAAAFADNGEEVDDIILSEEVQDESVETGFIPSNGEEGTQDNVANSDDSNLAIPAATQRVNEDVTLSTRTVAQAESTRSYFLAQTLESTRTVPIVSANLPLDTSAVAETIDSVANDDPIEDESGEDSDESDLVAAPIAAESIVVGSFEYRGITYAVEPGGESVALVAADYSKLPEEFVEYQVIAIPDAVTADGLDYYTVMRIVDNAFASLTKENANPDFTGCEALFADGELLAGAGVDAPDVEAFLNPESDMIDIDGDGEVDAPANPLKDCTGILAMSVPSSVASIGDEAFAGFDTLQYLIVSEDDPNYATFDGVLYDADLTNLRLIPEGRVGAVRVAPSATDVDPEVFSHCPSVTALVADPESELFQQTDESSFGALWQDDIDKYVVSASSLIESELCLLSECFTGLLLSQNETIDLFAPEPFIGVPGGLSRLSYGAHQDLPTNYYVSGNGTLVDLTSNNAIGVGGHASSNLVPFSWIRLWEGSQYPNNFTNYEFAYKDGVFVTLRADSRGVYNFVGGRHFYINPPNSGVRSVLYSWNQAGPFTRVEEGKWYYSDATTYFLINTGVTFTASEGGSLNGVLYLVPSSASEVIDFPIATPDEENGYGLLGWTFEVFNGVDCLVKKHLPASTKSIRLADLIDFEFQETYDYKFTAQFALGTPITWHGNGGAGHVDPSLIPVNKDSLLDVELNDFGQVTASTNFKSFNIPVRDGWEFDGWYADEACTDPLDYTKYSSSITDESTNRDYYAKWKAAATWDANGGTNAPNVSEVTTASYDSAAGAENRAGFMAPSKPDAPAGWEFAGWATTADPREGEELVQSGDTIYNHLLTDDAKAGNPTFYARWRAEVMFDTSRGSEASGVTGTNISTLPISKTVYASASDGINPLTATLEASSIASVTQKYYKFNGYRVAPTTGTPGQTTWYTYATLPAGTASANDATGGDAKAAYTDDMTFTLYGATNMTLLWAPIAYTVTFDAGKGEYSTAPGTVTGMVAPWGIDAADATTVPSGQVSRAWKRTYTYDDATVALPTPQLAGYAYTLSGGTLLGSAAAAACENNAFDAKQAAALADTKGDGTGLKTLAFNVTWEKSPFEIQVLGNTFPVGTGNYAFAGNGTPLLTISFDGSNGIVIPELFAKSTKTDGQAYFDDDYMSSFAGWTIGTLENDAFTPISTADIPNNGSLRSYAIGLSQLDAFFSKHGVQPAGSGSIVVYAQPNFGKTRWNATIVVPNDATLGGLDSNWNISGKSATRPYTCETSDFALPGTSDVKRFGYTFSQWKVTARKGGALVTTLDANPYTVTVGNDSVFRLPKNTIYDLTIEPDWVATNSSVRLTLGADDARFAGTSPATEFTIDFGQPMTAAKSATGGAYAIPSATRTNYTFLGYFDANGRQYITAGCGSARSWDKEPADAPYELVARWQSDDLTDEGKPTEPQKKVDATSPASKVTIRSNDGVSSAKDVLVGGYNGKMQWNSTADYPRSLDTVVVNVSSYTPNTGNTADQIRSDFGERPGHYILGFRIGSEGSYVPFYDLIYGNAFALKLVGSDLVRTGDPVAPTFTINPSKVKIVWSDEDPGYGDGTDPEDNPPTRLIDDGDLVANVFDAGAGAFKDAEGNTDRLQIVKTEIPSAEGVVLTKLPSANPVRAGYEFLGWSSVLQVSHKASGCDEFAELPSPKGQIPAIATCGTKTYYAHWAPHTYTVAIMGNYDGAPDPLKVTWKFGEQTDQPNVTSITRNGFACVGFFDTPEPYGGTMYLTRDGIATRAWDKGNEADPQANVADHRLYARWASTTGADDPDPFPGVEGVTPMTPTTNSNHSILVSALDGNQVSRTVLNGTYEGVFRFRQPVEATTPNATAPVQVLVNYYEPTAGIDKRDAELAAVQKAFEDNHPAGLPYLQGFRVMSTGDYIAWSDIVAGKSIDIDCLGRDLVWGGAYAAPASFRMDAKTADSKHVLVAVYGNTPSVDPNDGETVWPVPVPGTDSDPATEVRVLFDAGAGRFSDGTRFLAVKTAYKGNVVLPSVTSDLPLPVADDDADGGPFYKPLEGWSFTCWVDANGNKVDERTFVGALTGTVYYAKYTQQTWTVDFVTSDAAHKDVVLADGTLAPAGYAFGDVTGQPADIEPYDNQAFASKDFGYPVPSSDADGFTRAGYQFLGWFDSSDASQVTKAYFLTDKGREVMGSALLGAEPTAVTSDMTMHALWTPRTYTVEWYLNYPAYTIDGKEYPKTEGTPADLYRRDTNMVYGQPVAESAFVAPANPRYQFDMWAHGRTDSATAVVGAKGSIREQADNTYCFLPVSTASDTLSFCALWNTKVKTRYTITLYAGEGGEFGGGATSFTSDRYFDDSVYTLPARGDNDFPTTKNGYAFKNWVEADADGTVKAPTTVAESIPAGVTGNYAFVAVWTKNDYTVSLTNVGGLRPEQYGEGLSLDWDNEWSHDFKVGTTETWQLPTAEQMNALNAAQSHKVEGMSFKGWRLSGTSTLLPEPYTFDPVTYLAGFATHDDVKSPVYEAVWEAKTYTVVLDAGTDDDQHNNMVYTLQYDADKTLKLPVPVLRGYAGVFSHWDISASSNRNKAWVPGVEVSVPEIFSKGYYEGSYGEPYVKDEHVCGMREDGSLVDADMTNVIRLHARFNGAHNTDFPLQVTIFVDPETGDMILPEAYLRTSNTNLDAVAIEGITYEKVSAVEGAGLGEGTENVFLEALDRASLTVHAQKQGSSQVTDLSIPLKVSGTRTGADVVGFETFNKSNQLNITYGLDFDLTGITGATDKEKVAALLQTMYLPDSHDLSTTEANRSRLRFPIAKLYYTISLVRANTATPTAVPAMSAESAALMD